MNNNKMFFEVSYSKALKEFGAQKINQKILDKISKKKKLHRFFESGFFFAHRDFDLLLNEYFKGRNFSVVSGRGPSEKIHIAHLKLFEFVKYLQDEFGAFVFIPFSDDEKFLDRNISFEEALRLGEENAKYLLALGFSPKKTKIMFDFKNINQDVYNISIKAAKKTTVSTIKASMGRRDDSNIGNMFYPAMQAAHILYPTFERGERVLVPIGMDQDVFVKLTRDVAPKIGLKKPSTILSKFTPSVKGYAKMSASSPEDAIFISDSLQEIRRKVSRMFSGGGETLELHKKHGGRPERDVALTYLKYYFLNKKQEEKIFEDFRNGRISSKEVKNLLFEKIKKFKKKIEKAKKKTNIEKFLL